MKIVLRGRSIGLTKEVREWFRERGHQNVRLIQNRDGQVAFIGTENDGYALQRSYISGGRALRAALGIKDDQPRRYQVEPATDFDGLLVGEQLDI
jgi:hypothetical protein